MVMINLGNLTDWIQTRQDHEIDQRVRGGPHRQHVREPHRYLPRYSGRILRARTKSKATQLGHTDCRPRVRPRVAAASVPISMRSKRKSIQGKTRRGRITKLASVLGNPHGECAENASILMRSRRKSPPSASQGKS